MREFLFSHKRSSPAGELFLFICLLIVVFSNLVPLAEEQRNAPNTGQGHEGKHDAADRRALSAKQPAHNVELEQTDAPPVEGADND